MIWGQDTVLNEREGCTAGAWGGVFRALGSQSPARFPPTLLPAGGDGAL